MNAMLPLWYSSIYTDGIDPAARFPRERYRLLRERLEIERAAGRIQFHEAAPLPT